ncbi:MAG: hypothetical protein Q9187_008315, partial [Circinaria calcarea]
ERLSTSRHYLGFYRSVAVTAKYLLSETRLEARSLEDVFSSAVCQVVDRHPVLGCGIVGEEGNTPAFTRLEQIALGGVIEFRRIDAATDTEYDEKLMQMVKEQHSKRWPDLHLRPGWKLTIAQRSNQGTREKAVDAVFAFHHAIGDGTSGMAFHRSLLKALNNLPSRPISTVPTVIKGPYSGAIVPAVEDLIQLDISWSFLLRQIWETSRPSWSVPASSKPWSAAVVTLPHPDDFRSRVRFISLPRALTRQILSKCRKRETTLTGLLHGIIIAQLSLLVPEARSFRATTPYSLRPATGTSVEEIAVQLSALTTEYAPGTISAFRAGRADPRAAQQQIWEIARRFRLEMGAELAALPKDNLLGLLPYVRDWHRMWTDQVGKARSSTFEVSNLGSLRAELDSEPNREQNELNRERKDEEIACTVSRLIFSQSGMVAGAAFSFNIASVESGPLTVTLTWQEGVVAEGLMGEILEGLREELVVIGTGRGGGGGEASSAA